MLGASPDGVVTSGPHCPVYMQTPAAAGLQPDLLEVKCPFRARDQTVIDASAAKDFYLGSYNYNGGPLGFGCRLAGPTLNHRHTHESMQLLYLL